jgi:phi13 family phage major tail protein
VKVPGAVSITLDADGEISPFYADGIKYYIATSNQGYTGSLEMARIPDRMLIDIWGMEKDNNGVLIENVEKQFKDFALMFEIDGDAKSQRFCLFKVSATRPQIASQTNTETKEPQTQTMDISATPLLSNNNVLAKTTADTSDEQFNNWFQQVYTPANN